MTNTRFPEGEKGTIPDQVTQIQSGEFSARTIALIAAALHGAETITKPEKPNETTIILTPRETQTYYDKLLLKLVLQTVNPEVSQLGINLRLQKGEVKVVYVLDDKQVTQGLPYSIAEAVNIEQNSVLGNTVDFKIAGGGLLSIEPDGTFTYARSIRP